MLPLLSKGSGPQATPESWVATPIWRALNLARSTEEEKGTDLGMRGENESWVEEI